MADKDYFSYLGATQIFVGLSSMTQVIPVTNVTQTWLQRTAGGTLFIGGTGITWGGAYMVGSSEIIVFNGSPELYLAGAGSSVTVQLLFGKSAI